MRVNGIDVEQSMTCHVNRAILVMDRLLYTKTSVRTWKEVQDDENT